MFHARTTARLYENATVFAVFLTPLLFFVGCHDQFELPKLTFLTLLTVPLLSLELLRRDRFPSSALWTSLLVLFAAQGLSSLPGTSLSWRASLLGDYENFAGLATFLAFLAWFACWTRALDRALIEKVFFFNSLAALLSSLYAVGQHFQFDLVRWNPGSVNASREFAALGNPNFLSAYLAMSIPLFLSVTLRPGRRVAAGATGPGPAAWASGPIGLAFLILGTDKGLALTGLTPSPFFHGAVIALGVLFTSYFLLRFTLSKTWWTPLAGTALLCFGLFSTGSRGGFLGAFAGAGFWTLMVAWKGPYPRPTGESLPVPPRKGVFAALTAATVLLVLFGRPFLERLAHSITHAGESLAVSRLHIWRPALHIAEANPFLGTGLDTFKVAFPYYSGIEFNQIDGMFMSSRMAHNQLLQLAATTGLLGLAAYLAVLAVFCVLGWKAYRRAGPGERWALLAVFAAAAAYHIQNLFSFGVSTIDLLWFFCLAAVQAIGKASSPGPPRAAGKFALALKRATISVLILLFLWFPLRRFGADTAYGLGTALGEYLQRPDPGTDRSALDFYSDEEIRNYRKAAELAPLEVKYRLYLGQAYEQRARQDPERSRDWYLSALACYRQAAEMSPANAYYYNDLGRVYAELSRTEAGLLPEAEKAYRESVHWSPSSPAFLLNWASLLRKTGKGPEADEQVRRAFELDRAFSAKVLAQMAMEDYRTGDKPTAFRELADAIQGDDACAEAYYCRGILYLSEGSRKKALADLERTEALRPTREKNPSIQYLDRFLEQARQTR